MAQIRTIANLEEGLDKEISWRKKEILSFKLDLMSENKKYLLRAGIPILYAHWEGFVKKSALIYLEFIQNQNLKYKDLNVCFSVVGLKREIELLINSKKTPANIKALEFLQKKLDEKAILKLDSAIRTEFNLTFPVLQNILSTIGISSEAYDTKEKLINESLVARRNKIAHGEYLDVKEGDFSALTDGVISMLEAIKKDIINSAESRNYRSI